MFGLAYLVAFAVYLTVSILVIRWAVRFARKREKSGMLWGFVAAFIMYNIVFWDWIPTVVAHKYYCSTEAGFWVYKTVNQWKAENLGVAETLHYQISPSQKTAYGHLYDLNERFVEEVHKKNVLLLPTTISEVLIVDKKTRGILAKEISVGSYVNPAFDGLQGYKFWLAPKACLPDKLRLFRKKLVSWGLGSDCNYFNI